MFEYGYLKLLLPTRCWCSSCLSLSFCQMIAWHSNDLTWTRWFRSELQQHALDYPWWVPAWRQPDRFFPDSSVQSHLCCSSPLSLFYGKESVFFLVCSPALPFVKPEMTIQKCPYSSDISHHILYLSSVSLTSKINKHLIQAFEVYVPCSPRSCFQDQTADRVSQLFLESAARIVQFPYRWSSVKRCYYAPNPDFMPWVQCTKRRSQNLSAQLNELRPKQFLNKEAEAYLT